MELDIFMNELKKSLVARGVPEDIAGRHADTLRRSFDEEDLREIEAMESSDKIEALASSVAAFLMKKKPVQAEKQQNKPVPVQNTAVTKVEQDEDEVFDFAEGDTVTKKGKTVFTVGLIVTLPITLALLAAVYLAFAGVFAAIIAVIIALVAVMIGIVAGGAVISLIGIIYGVTQLFTFIESGIYEIGLGVTVAGVVLLLAVLIFNLAIRVMPILISKFAVFVGFVSRKIKELYYFVRRECYKL